MPFVTGNAGTASPAALALTAIADDDPVVLQLVGFGFQASQAKFAMARGREQGISEHHMVEACMDFILANPHAGVPPLSQGGSLICPRHILDPTPICEVRHCMRRVLQPVSYTHLTLPTIYSV